MRMNITSVALTWLLAAQLAQADDPINVSKTGTVLSDEVLYSIGGGSAVSMGSAGQMDSIGVGFGWNNDMMCGNMNLSTTLENQLNGATQGFQNIMGSVIQNATGAVMSLPALIIQRANPQLYNLITNGILQARIDYDRSKGTCRAIAEKMADIAGEQTGWGKIAEGQALGATLASGGKDAVSALEVVEKKGGNDGVTWVGGDKAGGSGQKPIRIVNDVTRAGYNLLTSRSVKDSSSVPSASCNNGLVCNTWSSPQEAAAFATRVLGEQQQQTCEGCQKTVTAAGVGLTPLIQETYDKKLQSLQELLSKSKPLTAENLAAAGTDALPITRGVIEALRDERDQDVLARRLASDVSLMDVLSKALLLQRLMFAGAKEPNVAANGLATQAVDQQTSLLQQEISNLKTELELRRELASNSPHAGHRARATTRLRVQWRVRVGARCRSPRSPAGPLCRRRQVGVGRETVMADTLTTRKLLGQLLVGVLIVIGLAVVGTLLSLFALNHFGGIQGLEAWRQSNYWSLFAWRALLYCALAIAWFRLKQQELSAHERQRIRRIEILVLLLVLLIEFSKAYFRTGGAA